MLSENMVISQSMPIETFSVESRPEALKQIREKVRTDLEKIHFPAAEIDKILVAVGEACTNSICHAYEGRPEGRIDITIEIEADRVLFRIRDYGKKMDLSKVKIPKLPPEKPHGLGIYFMKTMMDEFEYNGAHPQGNEVILVKYRKPEGNQPR